MTYHPSTKSLRAFETTARLGSIKAAAEYLHVSPSAVSRRIQSLEEELGQLLFVRDVQGLSLTEAGLFYAERLREVFKTLDDATLAVRNRTKRRLTVLGPPAVVQRCIDALHSIEEALPGVDLIFHTGVVTSSNDPSLAQADVAFFWGKSEWEGWCTAPITRRTYIVPVCSPGFLKVPGPLTTEDLKEHTWIVSNTFEDAWKLWHEALGTPLPTPRRTMKVSDGSAALQVAQNGSGICMGIGFLGLPNIEVITGHLVTAHAFHAFAPDYGFHIGLRRNHDNPDLTKFTDWFFKEVWNMNTYHRLLEAYKKKGSN